MHAWATGACAWEALDAASHAACSARLPAACWLVAASTAGSRAGAPRAGRGGARGCPSAAASPPSSAPPLPPPADTEAEVLSSVAAVLPEPLKEALPEPLKDVLKPRPADGSSSSGGSSGGGATKPLATWTITRSVCGWLGGRLGVGGWVWGGAAAKPCCCDRVGHHKVRAGARACLRAWRFVVQRVLRCCGITALLAGLASGCVLVRRISSPISASPRAATWRRWLSFPCGWFCAHQTDLLVHFCAPTNLQRRGGGGG